MDKKQQQSRLEIVTEMRDSLREITKSIKCLNMNGKVLHECSPKNCEGCRLISHLQTSKTRNKSWCFFQTGLSPIKEESMFCNIMSLYAGFEFIIRKIENYQQETVRKIIQEIEYKTPDGIKE